MLDRRRAGDQQNVWRAMKQPRQRDLPRFRFQRRCCRVERSGLQRTESSQREERHVSDALSSKLVDESVVISMRDVVQILHANDLRYFLRFRELPRSRIAQTDV